MMLTVGFNFALVFLLGFFLMTDLFFIVNNTIFKGFNLQWIFCEPIQCVQPIP